jgi:DNA-binding NarL/FixJ family response regulator
VLVVDEDPIVRRAVVGALGNDPGLSIVGDTADGDEGVRLALELSPDVVVLDPRLRLTSGLESVREIHDQDPSIGILLFSSTEDEEVAIRALRLGASGFLSKRTGLEALPRIVQSVARGEAVLTRTMTMRLIERLREVPEMGGGLRPVRSPLSSREWEVLDLMCAGGSTRSIAEDLELSIETVRSHVKRILRKLGAHSRAEAVELAAKLIDERTRAGPPGERGGTATRPQNGRADRPGLPRRRGPS